MTRGAGRWSLDKEKRKQPFSPDKRWKPYQYWRSLPLLVRMKRLEELGAGVWTKKSGSSRLAPTSAGSLASNGVLCHCW
ncbi:hypothetical protein QOZ98_000867 [Planomicrobium stackebrandtii]|uniref:Uncharacterized protein n=1 Tax=Planomicrobium stackebrandtii TaxID=253160 RepID=A0ABU0GRQ8_9BACL|nr:hypothetical protein [Planomicrobium stackebrandtii]MDQ0428041.1 hypothetical protein [Planomicrobium stackebrandtii]